MSVASPHRMCASSAASTFAARTMMQSMESAQHAGTGKSTDAQVHMMANQTNMVVLVDEDDNKIGLEEKMAAHSNGGRLHRAFSIFVFNSKRELMMQRRALAKYHAAGLWANTCCSHPFDGEAVAAAGHRRLMEEMGFDCELTEAFSFTYHAEVGNGLTENEFDHVLIGRYDLPPRINQDEVEDWKFMAMENLVKDAGDNPERYVPWLLIVLPKIVEWARRNIR